jgi:small subunit ribosomal protein S16
LLEWVALAIITGCQISSVENLTIDWFVVLIMALWALIYIEEIMVVIRLARGGSKKRPFYSLVAADSRNRRDGRFIERIGFYNPVAPADSEGLRIAMDRLTYWKSVGAQCSSTVDRLIGEYNSKQAV